jgi:hypothetical protein
MKIPNRVSKTSHSFVNFNSVSCVSFVSLLSLLGASAHATGPQKQEQTQQFFEPQFTKGASQFCISNLSAAEQSKVYSRIVNIGASFGHGCMGCDANKVWQGYTEMTDDQFWVRRNYLSHFFEQAPWKNPAEFRFEKLYVLENDGKTKPGALVSEEYVKNVGYSGEWAFDPLSGAFGLLSGKMKEEVLAGDPDLLSESEKVGGELLVKNPKGKLTVR